MKRIILLATTCLCLFAQNDYYRGNREPLLPSPFVKLPIGNVQPGGYLRHQLELMAAGFTGHLSEISGFCEFEDNAWVSRDGSGNPAGRKRRTGCAAIGTWATSSRTSGS